VPRVVQQGDEAILFVERLGVVVDGIDLDRVDAHAGGELEAPAHRIDEQPLAESASLHALI
jgi:hypothetical protein